MMAFPYELHGTILRSLHKNAEVKTSPSTRDGLVAEKFSSPRVGYEQMGLLSKHGPLMTKKWGGGLALNTGDGTVFECRTLTHAGKSIGPVFKKKFGGGLRRTQNWDQGA